MIFCLLGGDTFKAAYYSRIEAPIQLILCACFQITVDVLILWQFWLYRKDHSAAAESLEVQRLQKVATEASENMGRDSLPTGHEEPLQILTGE